MPWKMDFVQWVNEVCHSAYAATQDRSDRTGHKPGSWRRRSPRSWAADGLLRDTELVGDFFGGFLQIGDVNHDTEVNGLDVDPFVDVLLASQFDVAADMNGDGAVNGLDVDPFVAAVVGGTQSVPEPSTLLLVALGAVGGWRKWKRAA